MLVLDAAGLALFTATGTLRARGAGLPIVSAAVIGMITGIGGGLMRDVLSGEIPTPSVRRNRQREPIHHNRRPGAARRVRRCPGLS